MADYIIEPLDTDIETIFQDFVEYIQAARPTWTPNEGQLDVMIARYFAMQTAFTADMASRVQRAIFRYFGNSLAGIPPLPGSAARATVNFQIPVSTDPDNPPVDHTLDADTLVGVADRNGDIQMFSLLEDMVVLAGEGAASTTVQAIELGSAANGLTGAVQMIELVDWISSAAVVGASSGGSDPEEDEVYLQRLTANLALMAPRPIIAADFAFMAQNIPGVWRAAVIDNFGGGALEKQRIHSDRTGGNYKLAFNGSAMSALIPSTSTAEQVRAALAGLTTLDDTDISVTGGPLPAGDIFVEFRGRYAYADQPLMTADVSALTGGTTFAISQVTAGAAFNTTTENAIAISAVDVNGEPLDPAVKQELINYLASTQAQNFIITFVDPAYHVVDITYTLTAYQNADPDSVLSTVNINLAAYLSPGNWGQLPFKSQPRDWNVSTKVRYLDLTTTVENTPGVDFIESLSFALDGGASSTADKTFTGPFSLTRPGTFTGTVHTP